MTNIHSQKWPTNISTIEWYYKIGWYKVEISNNFLIGYMIETQF